jgi:ribosomal-protein-alanine N-acetyltransferase
MRWWDAEPVLELERELFADPWSVEALLSELAYVPQTRWYVVSEDERGLTGYAGLRAVGPDADVQTLAVAGRAQGRGVGGGLLDALLVQARERDCTQVFLEVRADNAAALALYAARGFVVTGVRPEYYGPAQDAALMRLDLAGADLAQP